ncbi:MAG: SDR family NAD(P)-dependent oxidoreductase [Prevotellaceae bacterium]|jgi:NADP-dependent 3-hydroxy acid dehydrogenase YdfG|nr:SDR family NAD(P)-dependent oxidoreductase [Prevotellaceae bacterium]
MKRIALITGATSGFGEATARLLAENSYNLIISGRRKDRLGSLQKELAAKFGVDILALSFDVRSKEEVNNAIDGLPQEWKKIDVLVNNAGLAVGLEHIQNGNTDDWDRMIDTNIKGLLYMTRAVAPLMVEQGHGHIVNIGSTAGKDVYENGNVYCGTKFAVDAISKATRIDLLKHNVKVTQICPGLAETEFSIVRFKGDKEKAKTPYAGIDAMTAEDIAGIILYVISLPPHLCINDLVVSPTAQANAIYTYKK